MKVDISRSGSNALVIESQMNPNDFSNFSSGSFSTKGESKRENPAENLRMMTVKIGTFFHEQNICDSL